MRHRFGFVWASALVIGVGACASGTGGGGGGGGGGSGMILDAGRPENETAQTQQAENNLAMAMLASGDQARQRYQEAFDFAEAAIQADRQNPLPWLQGAKAAVGLERYAEADSMYSTALDLRPAYTAEIENDRVNAWYGLYEQAAPFLTEQNYDEALPLLESANAIHPGRPEMVEIAGRIYSQLGQHDEAIEHLTRSLQIISDNVEQADSATAESWRELEANIPPTLANAYIAAARYDDAIATLRPMVDEDPTNASLLRALATIYSQVGQEDSARVLLQRWAGAAGDDLTPEEYFLIGNAFYEMDSWIPAAENFGQALDIAPYDREAAEWMSRALQNAIQDGEEEATAGEQLVEAAGRWVELEPNGYVGYIHLMTGYLAAGDTATAGDVAAHAESLEFQTDFMEILKDSQGASVFGNIKNVTMNAGDNVTLRFIFYGENGAEIGDVTETVALPAPASEEEFRVDISTDTPILGYGYEVVTGGSR